VLLASSVTGTIIGGAVADAGNTIAYNADRGVTLWATAGTNNSILGNSIFENTRLGIDLGNNGPTPNDPGDADASPNKLQNFPDLTNAFISGSGDLRLTYSIDTDLVNATYPLTAEFFRADADNEEGQTFLGRDTYTTTDHGGCGTPPCEKTVNLGGAAVLGVAVANHLVATATDDDGNTSEFSVNLMITGPMTRYVAIDGSDDGNDCTNSLYPCATLAHAVSQANDGDIIDLAAGTYDETVVIVKKLILQGQGVVVQ